MLRVLSITVLLSAAFGVGIGFLDKVVALSPAVMIILSALGTGVITGLYTFPAFNAAAIARLAGRVGGNKAS